jgi:hypothetical protein
MPQSWDMGQIIPSEGRHAVDFSSRKNPTASVGSEPAILGTKGQHANPYTTEAALALGLLTHHFNFIVVIPS